MNESSPPADAAGTPAGRFDGHAFLRTVSRAPGVYAMFDARGNCLYVGKAANLRNRLGSYFRGAALPAKTMAMVARVAEVRIHITRTEGEALLLESNLIKEHRPRYNIVLRDDKSYPYIRLGSDHPYPGLAFYRGSRRQPGRYFGPYPSAASVRDTLAQIQKVIPIRQCSDSYFRNRSRPCLQYQIHRCTAPCVDYIGRAEYAEDVAQAVMLLEGREQSLAEHLQGRMDAAAARLDFETAALYRDRIAALRRIQASQYVADERSEADVVGLARREDIVAVQWMFIRHGQVVGSRCDIHGTHLGESDAEVLRSFLSQYYSRHPAPPEIVLGADIEERALLEAWLSERQGRRVRIRTRCRGRRRRWLDMVERNAGDELDRHLSGKALHHERLAALAELLDLGRTPDRIECFDVSHTQGEGTVASCVVFGADGPVNSLYRRYNIRGAAAGDDYGALREALSRRFRKGAGDGEPPPEVLLVDGGRGQLGIALEVLAEAGLEGIQVVGVAKGPSRKPGLERLFLSTRDRASILDRNSPALHLIQHVRDEAHRFAITGHRQRSRKARVASPLQEIPGIGGKRRQALLKHFGGIREVERAGVEELRRVPGISPTLAKRIYEHFH